MKATVQTEPRRATDARPELEYLSPGVNIFETSDGYVLEAEMPGVTKEGLEITLEGNEITIVGRRMDETAPGEPLFRERALADYRRVFELDPAIDTGRIAAKMDQGLLTLTLPKSEKVKPRRIKGD
jgi:HSP20 family protein